MTHLSQTVTTAAVFCSAVGGCSMSRRAWPLLAVGLAIGPVGWMGQMRSAAPAPAGAEKVSYARHITLLLEKCGCWPPTSRTR
jgi:hypothetical protein